MIYVLGVEHFAVQLPHKDNDAEKIAQFLKRVRNICEKRGIDMIAEESSKDALSYQNIESTHVGKIVSQLKVEYVLCDPGFAERDKIGVKQREEIAKELAIPFPPTTSEQENKINEVAAESDRKREKYWLDQIKFLDGINKNVLLICGFGHVDHFIKIAKGENCVVQKIT